MFPVYLTFIASTHDAATIANGQMPLTPGPNFFKNYYQAIFIGPTSSTRTPVGMMMLNSFIMAMMIAVGKIAISLLSAFAVVYFRFPFRMAFFWLIFITLMLPVEVRIYPTYKIVSDLGMLDTFAGPDDPADRVGHRHVVLPAVLHDHPGRAGGGLEDRRRGAVALLLGHGHPAVAHQHRGACS